ncbi:3-oxoacyl-ACP reductase family protein [Arcobacter vandammei]|uniref:3-oxoacyl-ACP reductase family protein n=1 Tax=Arcobacter vandammei TaxID=2782243 RepID=UPI0018DFA5B9|nr:3-oxoacyl-ACP reductase family protein [Arcobacter vandammei]
MKKVALVVGGSKGIGKAIVERFVKEDYFVYFTYNRSQKAAQEIVSNLGEDKVEAFLLTANDDENATKLIQKISNDKGKIDVFVNNAGITKDNYFSMMSKADWNSVIDVNLNSVFHLTKLVSKIMMQKKSGSIILISSISAYIGQIGQANYSASKAALIAFSRSVAKELAKFNIRVNTITPGFIQTDMTKKISTKILEEYIKNIPLQRQGLPEEVANVANFLASNESSYITSSNIVVDGGLI